MKDGCKVKFWANLPVEGQSEHFCIREQNHQGDHWCYHWRLVHIETDREMASKRLGE